MKSVLLTGLTGTLAPVVAHQFSQRGWQIIDWNHHSIDPNQAGQCQQFWQQHQPDAVCHLAMGSEQWAAWLATKCREANIPFLFVSSAMVFDGTDNGPYDIWRTRNARDDYGQYKIRCEDAIWRANPDAMVARIGWQIDPQAEGNNMLCQLDQQFQQQGEIVASREWIPATSRMQDTAIAFLQLIERNEAGLYHLDSNARTQWSFYQLVLKLKRHFGRQWRVTASDDYPHDQRLLDERIALPDLTSWLPCPGAAIIGCNWGVTHITNLRRAGAEVKTLCANNLTKAQQTAQRYQVAQACNSIADLTQHEIIVLATPADSHAGILAELADNAIICEKPLLGVRGDRPRLDAHRAPLLVNYAFSQLNTAAWISRWLQQQPGRCHITLHSSVNLPGDFSLAEWFLETASHPVSWLLHLFGEPEQIKRQQQGQTLSLQFHCQKHQLEIHFQLGDQPGIHHQWQIETGGQKLECGGGFTPGYNWRFEPIRINGETVTEGEYSDSDCWHDANRRLMCLMVSMLNGNVDWQWGLDQGAFDKTKALWLEKLLDE
ncbi:sugar nucleotide-binding protein [Vibrio sp.]|uniref:sugar nucleotide-binding protein n=1 Tax=Vibrio sp. TaxID=678 RepID=UPI003D11A27C